MHVAGATKGKVQHARAHGVVADAVDENETARVPVHGVRIERDLAVELEIADTDLVQVELGRRQVLHGIHVQLVLEGRNGGVDRLAANLH